MKIVIVGGGSAGWIAATCLVKFSNFKDITVIESSKLGIIGAGEGSTGTLPFLVNEPWPNGDYDNDDFFTKTKCIPKLALTLKNWKGDGTNYYSAISPSQTKEFPIDTMFMGSILKYGRGDYSSLNSWILQDNNSSYNKKTKSTDFNLAGYAYHVDAIELGKYFKEKCIKFGVKVIDSEVVDTTFDNNENLKSIKLENGDLLDSDLWIDATGFSKVLISKTKNKWISYKNELPVNSAIPYQLDISSRLVRFETLAETMNSGWMWKIPLQHRYGCGYVYSDNFQSYDTSVNEIQRKVGGLINPIREIKFEAGRYEKVLYNNILCVGLSSHFLEPLQATSIHISITTMTHLLTYFVKNNKEEIPKFLIDRYNQKMGDIIDDYKDLIQFHYLAGRNDTPFWKFIQNEMKISDKNKYYMDIAKYRSLNIYDIDYVGGAAGWPVWSHIFDNAGMFNKEWILNELNFSHKLDDAYSKIKEVEDMYKKINPDLATAQEVFKILKQ